MFNDILATIDLAQVITGTEDDDIEATKEALKERFCIELDDLHKLIKTLLPMTIMGVASNGSVVQGFAAKDENGEIARFLVCQEVVA